MKNTAQEETEAKNVLGAKKPAKLWALPVTLLAGAKGVFSCRRLLGFLRANLLLPCLFRKAWGYM